MKNVHGKDGKKMKKMNLKTIYDERSIDSVIKYFVDAYNFQNDELINYEYFIDLIKQKVIIKLNVNIKEKERRKRKKRIKMQSEFENILKFEESLNQLRQRNYYEWIKINSNDVSTFPPKYEEVIGYDKFGTMKFITYGSFRYNYPHFYDGKNFYSVNVFIYWCKKPDIPNNNILKEIN